MLTQNNIYFKVKKEEQVGAEVFHHFLLTGDDGKIPHLTVYAELFTQHSEISQ